MVLISGAILSFENLSICKAFNVTIYKASTNRTEEGEAGYQYLYLGNPRQSQFALEFTCKGLLLALAF